MTQARPSPITDETLFELRYERSRKDLWGML